jgi:hypothetical protein
MTLSPQWKKSSESDSADQCVEVRLIDGKIQVRDSKHPNGAVLSFTVGEWNAFLGGTRAGEFDVA